MPFGVIKDLVDVPQTDCESCRRLRLTGGDEMGPQERKLTTPLFQVLKLMILQPESPAASGADMVHAQAIFAIIGAISLEKGSAVANQVSRDRILGPLGLFATR